MSLGQRIPSQRMLSQRIVAMYDRTQYASPRHESFYRHSGYSNVGYWYADTRDGAEAGDNLVDRLLGFIPEPRSLGAVLDVACGQGGTTRRLGQRLPRSRITAVNLSPRQLRRTAEHAPGCAIAAMDGARLGFADAAFDLVVCVEAAFHFDTRAAFLREARRVLRPGGHLLVADVLLRGRRINRALHAVGYPVTCPVANHHSMAEYLALLERAGFCDVVIVDELARTYGRFWKKFLRACAGASLADLKRWPRPAGDPISLPVLVPYLLAQTFWFQSYVLVHARAPAVALP